MNKESFMQELARLLGDISPQERQEALNFYEEYFHDAGPEKEQEVLKELGSPMQVAAKIKEGLDATIGVENGPDAAENGAAYTPQETVKKRSAWKTIGLVFLLICASPLLIAFASVILSLLIAWFLVLISLIAAFGAAALTCILCGIAFVVMGFTCMFSFPYVCLIMAGSGLICTGIGILFMMLTVWMCAYALPGCCRGIAWVWRKIFGKKQA